MEPSVAWFKQSSLMFCFKFATEPAEWDRIESEALHSKGSRPELGAGEGGEGWRVSLAATRLVPEMLLNIQFNLEPTDPSERRLLTSRRRLGACRVVGGSIAIGDFSCRRTG